MINMKCEKNYINDEIKEPVFVSELRNTHCKGCRDEHSPKKCTACQIIDCWLRKTYLPSGLYAEAIKYDIVSTQVDMITKEINKKIINDILKNK